MRTSRLSLAGVVILLAMGGLGGGAFAQGTSEPTASPESILFIGNSNTYWNDGVETHLVALAAAEDPPRVIEAARRTAPSYTLDELYRLSMPDGGPAPVETIRAGGHDVVVLQGTIPSIYDQDVDTFLEHARLFDAEVKDAGAETVFYMTWPLEGEDWITLEGIADAHWTLGVELGAAIAPVGMAMASASAERPSLPMLDDDMTHPSMAGTYLAANVIYAVLFDEDPQGLPYRPDDLTEDDAAFLQGIARAAVQEWKTRSEPSAE